MLGDQTAQWLAAEGVTLIMQFLLGLTGFVVMLAFLLHAGRSAGPRF